MDSKEKGWSWTDNKNFDRVLYEDGSDAKLTPDLIMLERGKYAGLKLSEVDDVPYIKNIINTFKEEKNKYGVHVFASRLNELI